MANAGAGRSARPAHAWQRGFACTCPRPSRPRGSRPCSPWFSRTRQDRIWDPEGPAEKFGEGFLFQSTYDTTWKDVLGFRGRRDPDKPVGEWNRAEIVAKGGDITYFLNGRKILEAVDGSYTEGRIMFQSEGAEIFFRRIELHPLAP